MRLATFFWGTFGHIREAFNQINRYQRDSFWAGSGLFEYVQLFVISNGTLTKYYSNTVRDGHLKEQSARRGQGGSKSKTSNSFAFTSWWADALNRPITELAGFTKTFFAKHSLLNVLTKYCVFDVDRKLLVMRPYQIVAAERILQRIATATNHKLLGTVAAGGYIWHTTGSGKTLTSFKAAQLARGLPHIDKVLFVVDRKDLDYQTMREYERFEKGAANSNASTAVLQKQLEDPNARIIITTIQKLSRFVAKNKKHTVYDAHVVVLFDECHRSQFGHMHFEITRVFRHYHLFGFTGTPIFAENSGTTGSPLRRTTAQAFGDKLHTYTIVDAISDKNVLPFRIDYINTIKTAAVVFEIELIKQVEINVDYILLLVEQYLKKKGTGDDKEIRATIERAINSSPGLRNKKDLIEQFVDSVNTKAKVDAQWQAFVATKKAEELERIITEENLNAEAARNFIDNAFRDGGIPTTGTAITKILPPVSRFNKSNSHAAKKQTVLDKLAAFFERYFGLA